MLVRWQLLAAEDGHIHADLHRHADAADFERDLGVDVPAERTGRELLDLGDELLIADGHVDRLGTGPELGAADRTGGFLRHDSPLPWVDVSLRFRHRHLLRTGEGADPVP